MTTFENELENQLEDLAQTVDPAGQTRVLQGVRRAGRRRRRAKVAAFATGIAVAAGVVFGLIGVGTIGAPDQGSHSAQPANGTLDEPVMGVPLAKPGEPCPMAKHAKSAAELNTNRPFWTPANATLTDAWTCGKTPVLMYGEIEISYESGWDNIDVDKKWADLIRDRGGRIETVLGRPAWVRPADNISAYNNLMVVVDGTLIRALSKGHVPIDKSVELTNSIELPPSLKR